MKHLLTLFTLLVLSLPARAAYNLVWSEEFDGSSLNTEVWNYETGTGNNGWGNGESQYYTSRTDNVAVTDGNLVITAKKESYSGSSYTSARITTASKVQVLYGRLEARILLPPGQMGVWPAFWMLCTGASGWPYQGEIDIMEYMCNSSEESWRGIVNTYHWNNNGMDGAYQNVNYGLTAYLYEQPSKTGYLIYGLEWTPDYLVGYIANEANSSSRTEICRMDISSATGRTNGLYAFKYPGFFILNMALGGSYVSYQIDPSFSQAQMKVDYIRVYQDSEAYPESSITAPSSSGGGTSDIDVCANPFSSYSGVSATVNDGGNWITNYPLGSISGTTVTATPTKSYTNMYVIATGNGNDLAAGTEYRLSGTLTASQSCTAKVYIEAASDNKKQLFTDNSLALQAGVAYNFSVTATNGEVLYNPAVVIAADNNPANCTFTLSNVRLVATSCSSSAVEDNYAEQLTVWPNPASNILHIDGVDESCQYQVFDTAGRLMLKGEGNEVEVSSLTKGIYLLQTEDAVVRFIKN